MTPKPEGGSLTHPCPMTFSSEWCGGIAALINNQYICQKCGMTWQLDGTPKTVKDNQ